MQVVEEPPRHFRRLVRQAFRKSPIDLPGGGIRREPSDRPAWGLVLPRHPGWSCASSSLGASVESLAGQYAAQAWDNRESDRRLIWSNGRAFLASTKSGPATTTLIDSRFWRVVLPGHFLQHEEAHSMSLAAPNGDGQWFPKPTWDTERT